LVRELGMRESLAISIAGGGFCYSLLGFSAFFAFVSDVNLTWPYVIVPFLFIPLCFVYSQLVATMPRSGGDFINLSRIFHPIAGAMIGVGFLLFLFTVIAGNSIGLPSLALTEVFRVLGQTFNSGTLTHFSASLASNHTTQFLVGAGSLVLIAGIAALGPRAITNTILWCFAAGLIGLATMAVVGFSHSPADFARAYDAATAPGAHDRIIAAAHASGIGTGSTISGFLKYLPYAAVGLYGWTMANFTAGEIKRRGSIFTISVIGGLFVTAAGIVIGWLAVQHLTGSTFFKSAAGLSAADPATFAKITGGKASTIALFYPNIVTGHVGAILISVGVMLGYLMFALMATLVISRLVFALSFDRLLPTRWANVNERTHVPIYAILVGFVGCVGVTALVAYWSDYPRIERNVTLCFSVELLLGSIAVMFLPFRRRDLWEAGPKVVPGQFLNVPRIVWLGGVAAIIQAVILYYSATNTGISGGYDFGSVATLVGIFVAGLVAYVISRTYLKRKKIDIDLAMKELPPE
jgi:amino acid transporter